MSSNTSVKNHITVENLNAQFVEGANGIPLMFAVRGFSASITQNGLSKLVAALIPQEPLKVRIVDHPGVAGCTIQIQAARMGFTPRITVSIVPAGTLAGAILINVDPANRWSPLDRVMLGIAHHNLDKIAVKQPSVTRLRTGVYQIDLQGTIRDLLLDNSAPVRWDTRLEAIDGSAERIRVEFVSFVEGSGFDSGPAPR
jgi:hypothetical protein